MPAELRILVTSVRLDAAVEPRFLKSTVTFVEVPDVEGLGEIACSETSTGPVGAGDEDGLAGVLGAGLLGAGLLGAGLLGAGLLGAADGLIWPVGVEDGAGVAGAC